MKKVTINIENGDSFELMVDGEVSQITITTDKGEYEINKVVKKKNKIDFEDFIIA